MKPWPNEMTFSAFQVVKHCFLLAFSCVDLNVFCLFLCSTLTLHKLLKWPVKECHTFLKPSGGLHSAVVTRALTKLHLYVCQWAWLLLRLCCMMGAFLAIYSMTFWTWMKWMGFFFLNMCNTNGFNGNRVFVHSWPTKLRCSIKNPTLVDAALNIIHTDSGVVRFPVITARPAPVDTGSFQVWKHLNVSSTREKFP